MSAAENVQAFHTEGSEQGTLFGVYHFNARQIHCLTPEGGTVVDLGCGSGRLLGYVAHRRPDLRIIGLDLSEEMVDVGNEMLREQRLSDRVELRVGDMTSFTASVPNHVHLVVSTFSLHHLPTSGALHTCLRQIERIRSGHGAALWIFDHARPRRRETAESFPNVFTPLASPPFNADSTNSLIASWSFGELCSAIAATLGDEIESRLARLLRLYQIHWAGGQSRNAAASLWSEREPDFISKAALADAKCLASLFDKFPQRRV